MIKDKVLNTPYKNQNKKIKEKCLFVKNFY